jgi:PKD repeat protein
MKIVRTSKSGSICSLIVLLSLHLSSGEVFAQTVAKLGKPLGGQAALNALGQSLPAVAEAHRMQPEELRRVLLQDHTARLDRDARLFYQEEAPANLVQAGATAQGSPMSDALAPLDQTFLLHSRPGASKIIYLDFNGFIMSGTAWNAGYTGGTNVICPAWSLDGDPTTFNDAERTAIQQIWLRVSEDYSPFDVDVTTEDMGDAAITRSSSSDTNYGMRILISPIHSYFGNYGGIAYVGVYANVGDYYKPALVFPEMLANNEKYIAEACSHECGHTLGLSHDGTTTGTEYYAGQGSGDTGWAPIMGVGYYENLVQWSKGEYPNANNTQDDTAIIASYIPYRPDDHGDTIATATVLPVGSTISASGYIERSTDVDVFRFATGTGAVSINLFGAERGPNVDILAELLDANGNIIATNNPTDYLTAGFALNLTSGTYYLRVRGTGKGDLATGYSNYGCLGAYFISGTVVDPSGTVPPVAAAAASPASGSAPVNVQFSSAGSMDPDGSIVAYAWNFGDGYTSTAPNPAHTFNAVGTYTVTLVVTDNTGLTGSTSLTVSALQPNILPVAIASATPSSGYAPLSVTLSGANSYDTDGTISSYQWNFGDGSTGSGQTVQHSYAGIGNFTATLTVTDNRGGSSSANTAVSTLQDPSKQMRVSSLALAAVSVAGGKQVKATIKITNPSNIAISGAMVTGNFSGAVTGTGSASTDANGNAVITSKKFKKGTVTFTVTGVVLSGYVYSPGLNLANSATISAASP